MTIESEVEVTTGAKPGETVAAPETAAASGATAAPAEQPKPVEVTFTAEQQAKVNEIVEKRLAREKRQRERELEASRPATVTEAPKDPEAPKREDFDSYEDYIRADARHVAKQELKSEREAQVKQEREAKARDEFHRAHKTHEERENAARVKYSDYDDVARDDTLPITEDMAFAITHADDSAELLYWLGHNRTEAQRIASLPPRLQAKEIGKLEAKYANSGAATAPGSKPAPVSKAPDPIEPVGAKGAGTGAAGKPPTDPDEYRAWRTAQRLAEASGKRA